jgi:hypothetical protein
MFIRIRSLVVLVLTAFVFLFAISTVLQADTIYSNLGAGNSFDPTTGYYISEVNSPFGGIQQAVMFTVPGSVDYTLSSVTLPLEWWYPNTIGTSLWIFPDDNGMPSSDVTAFFMLSNGNFGVGGTLLADYIRYPSETDPILHAGNSYWVEPTTGTSYTVRGTDYYVWCSSPTATNPTVISQAVINNAGWQVQDTTGGAPGLLVSGTPAPEPGSLTLLGTALLGLAGTFYLRRRRAKV